MAAPIEQVQYGRLNTEKPLCVSGRPKSQHLPLSDSGTGLCCNAHSQVNESGTYEGRLIRDQAAVTAVHTVNARARNIR